MFTWGPRGSAPAATETFFFAHNNTAAETVTGAPVTERTAFLALLSSYGTATFESLDAGGGSQTIFDSGRADQFEFDAPLTGLTGKQITVKPGNPGLMFFNCNSVNSVGRFPTDGTKYIEVDGDFEPSLPLTIKFRITPSNGFNAFGLYMTDIGDFQGTYTFRIVTNSRTITPTATVPNPTANGCLTFWGAVLTPSETITYVEVEWANPAPNYDAMGFDGVIFGYAT